LASEVLGAVDINEPHESSESVLFINNVPHGTFEIQKVSQQNLVDENSSQENQGASTFAPSTFGSESNTATGQTATPLVVALAETPDEPTPEIPQESHTTVSSGDGISVTPSANGTTAENYTVSLSQEVKKQIQTNESNIEVLKEGVNGNTATIDELKPKVEKNVSDINSLKTTVAENETNIVDLQADVSGNTAAIDELKPKVEKNESDINSLKTTVAENETNIVDLQAGVSGNTAAIDELKPKVEKNESDIDSLKTTVAENETNIGDLQTGVNNNTEAINNLTPKVDQNTTEIGGLKTKVGKNEGNIVNLQTRVTQNENDIDGLQVITKNITSSDNNTTIDSNTTINGQANIAGNTTISGSLVVGDAGLGSATINNGNLVLSNGGKNISIDATSGTITGLSNVNWNWNDIREDRVATEGQVAKIAASAFTFTDEHSGRITLPLASELQFTSGKNIEIHVSDDEGTTPKISFVLNQHPEFTTVTTGNVTMSSDGISFGMGDGQVRLTANGLDSGFNKLTNVADGVDDYDAVNVLQWNSYKIADIKGADENTVVTLDTSETKEGRTYLISVKHPEGPTYKAGNGIEFGEPAEGSKDIPISVVSNDENIIVGNGIRLSNVIRVGTPDKNNVAPVEIDGEHGTIRLKNITWVFGKDYSGSTNVATEGQLYTIANEGWKVSADENKSEQRNIPIDSELSVLGGTNISTTFDNVDGQKKLIINTTENPKFSTLETTGGIIAGGAISAQTNFDIPLWDPVTGIDKGNNFINSISGLKEGANFVVTQKQLYDAISNLNLSDRYVVDVQVEGDIVTLKQNNHEDKKFKIPTISSTPVVSGNILLDEDLDNDQNNGNWTATEYVDGTKGRVFTNTTLDKENSGSSPIDYGQNFVIKDTAGNQINIDDIASAGKLGQVSETVKNHGVRITTLEEGFFLEVDGTEPNDFDRVKAGSTVVLEQSSENIEIKKHTPTEGKQVVRFDVNKNLKLETLTVKAADSGSPDYPSTEIVIDNEGVGIVNNDSTDYYLTKGGLNAAHKPIENVATETNFDDKNTNALNVAAFYPTYNKVHQGFTLKAEEGKTEDGKIKNEWKWADAGQTLNILGGTTQSETPDLSNKNIKTSIVGGSLYVSLVRDPKIDTVTVGVDKDKLIRINPNGLGHIEGIQNLTWELNQIPHAMKKDEEGNLQVDENGKPTGTSWAATESQLYFLEHGLVDQGTSYAGDDYDHTTDTIVNPKLNEVLLLQGGGKDITVAKENIKVERIVDEEGKKGFNIGLSKDLKLTGEGSVNFETTKLTKNSLFFEENVGSSTTNIKATYSGQGLKITDAHADAPHDLEFSVSRINADDQIIQGVASSFMRDENGKPSLWETEDSNFAANLGDVKALRTQITARGEEALLPDEKGDLQYSSGNIGLALKKADVDGHLLYDIKLNDTIKLGGTDSNPAIVIDGSGYPGSTIYVNHDGKGDIIGLQNRDTNADDFATVGRAATEEQLKLAMDGTTNKGLNFTGDTGGTIQKKLGETVTIYGGASTSAETTKDDNILVTNKDGKLHIQLLKKLNLGNDGQILFGDESHKLSALGLVLGNASYLPIGFVLNAGTNKEISITENNISMGGLPIENVASGKTGQPWPDPTLNNAANIGDLEQLRGEVTKGHTVVTVNGGTPAVEDDYSSDEGKLLLKKTVKDGQSTYDVKLSDNIKLGKKDELQPDGTILNGINGSIEIAGKKGDGVKIHADDGKGHLVIHGQEKDVKADLTVQKKDEYTRLQYNGDKYVATLDDGLKFAANFGEPISLKLNQEIKIIGNLAKEVELQDLVDGNLGVEAQTGGEGDNMYNQLVIKMKKDISLPNGSLTIGTKEDDPNPIRIQKEKKDENGVSNGGTSFGGEQIHNVASGRDGTIWDDPKKNNVANIGDLEQLRNDVAVTHNFHAEDGKVVPLGNIGDLHILGDDNYLTTSLAEDGKGIRVKLNENKLGEYLKGENGIHYFSVKSEKELVNYNNLGADAENSLAIGAEAQVLANAVGGVAIGFGSVSNRQAGELTAYVIGETPDDFDTATWVSTAGAFSVGNGAVGSIVTRQITNVAAGSLDTDAVNVAQLKLLKDYVDNKVINASGIDGIMQFAADSGDKITLKNKEQLKIAGDTKNITTESDGKGQIAVKLKDDIEVNSVKVGGNVSINNYGFYIGATGPNQIQITEKNINMGGNQIHGVAPGTAPTDAVNVSQLNQVGGQILSRINDVDKRAKAGIAQAIATAGLPQAYLPGKNLMAASAGTFDGQTAFAVGISSISDDGKWIVKGTFSGNSQSKFGGSVGVGYQW